jgi:glycerol-3-phosphate acyltransferase PlsY
MLPALVIIVAYLLGSIPFGYLFVRRATGGDVRATGSGGTGATNVSRSAGKKAGILTLMFDTLKGVIAVLLALLVLTSDWTVNWWVAAAGVAVIVGHIFPVWLKFRGGKGVATGLGVFAILAPSAVMLAALLFLILVWRTRYVSLGSVIAAAAIPVFVLLLSRLNFIAADESLPTLAAAAIGSLLIIFMHRANINRLIRGTENRLR